MKSVMQHAFSQIPKVEIPRSVFNRSHAHKTTFDASYLVPILVDEALPGDTFNLRATLFARMTTPIFPIMDNMFLDTFYFAVPIRLLWDNWQKFCGEQENPGDSTDFNVPEITTPGGGYAIGSLSDYMGIPTGINGLPNISALWHRAYNLIWNTWFRDQNMQSSVPVNKGDGPDDPTDYVLLKRGKRHDYFTSALPWPQKGDAVLLPIGDEAPVLGNGKSLGLTNSLATMGLYSLNSGNGEICPDEALYNVNVGTGKTPTIPTNRNIALGVVTSGESGLYADLSNATAVTINALREAVQAQRMLERDARGGTRYTELILSHFGVRSPDARMQRPEFLGGSSCRVNVHPVQQTSAAAAQPTPLGTLSGFAVATDQGGGFTKSFTEHCVIIGLASVRGDLTYQNGIPRMFSRSERFDFYWPALAHLGEQEILNKEICATGGGSDAGVFGYQERYAEYRYKPSQISGKFRSNDPLTLDSWHLSQNFVAPPSLNTTFIKDSLIDVLPRCLAVNTDPHQQFIFDSYFDMKCARPMPVYSVPGQMDHF